MERTLEEALKRWRNNPDRRPIILRGARQVGKSYLVEQFGATHFESMATINFEYETNIAPIFETLNPLEIVRKLEKVVGMKIIPGKTLLFLDEIQQVPRAILALRYFREKLPDLHVIAAGSLLEFALHDEAFSFPVGRVEFLYMKPLSFREFMLNGNKKHLYQSLQEVSVEKGVIQFFTTSLFDM